jgi:RNA polymerase sigma-70 factor (ECF subfamily)
MTEVDPKSRNTVHEDHTLVLSCQEGDRGAFDALVIKYKEGIFNLCYRLLGDYHEANDSAQEIFLKAYGSIRTFRFKAKFSTWLYQIGINTCKNRLKSVEYRQRKKTVPFENPGQPACTEPSLEIHENRNSPGRRLENKERMQMIQDAINGLTHDQKTVITLRDIQGFSYEEISGMTGLNLGTVKSKLSRARRDLREKLRGLV